MSDLIERQAAIDAIGGNEPVGDPSKMDDDDVVKMWERIRIINIINKLQSAQPDIIRCKDCRWQKDQSGSTAWLPCRVLVTPDDFYCGRAERRNDGEIIPE